MRPCYVLCVYYVLLHSSTTDWLNRLRTFVLRFRETKRRIVERLENNEDKVLSDAHIRVVQNTRAVNYLKYFLKNTN